LTATEATAAPSVIVQVGVTQAVALAVGTPTARTATKPRSTGAKRFICFLRSYTLTVIYRNVEGLVIFGHYGQAIPAPFREALGCLL
jgi:hypothetical protein